MKNFYLSAFFILTILSSCEKGLFSPLPKVQTLPVTIIDATHVTLNGEVTDEGKSAVIMRGFCWGMTTNPTVNDVFSQNEFGPGEFTETLRVIPKTIYFVKAYATNSKGTSYGDEITFKTEAHIPIITTDSITQVTAFSAVINGTLVNDGGVAIMESGVCWNTFGNPTINDDKTSIGSIMGPFSCTITDLFSDTDYFVRTFATNSLGTGYGAQLAIKTLEGPMIEGSATLAAGTTGDLSDAVVGLYQSIDDWNKYRPIFVTNVIGSGSQVHFLFDSINPGNYYLDIWADIDKSDDWSLGDIVGWYGTGTKNNPHLQAFIVSNGKTVSLNITCFKL